MIENASFFDTALNNQAGYFNHSTLEFLPQTVNNQDDLTTTYKARWAVTLQSMVPGLGLGQQFKHIRIGLNVKATSGTEIKCMAPFGGMFETVDGEILQSHDADFFKGTTWNLRNGFHWDNIPEEKETAIIGGVLVVVVTSVDPLRDVSLSLSSPTCKNAFATGTYTDEKGGKEDGFKLETSLSTKIPTAVDIFFEHLKEKCK